MVTKISWRVGVTLSLTWSRAEKPPYSAMISGFEHLLGIIMEKIDFQRHFSIILPELCFFGWIRAEIRIKYALSAHPTRPTHIQHVRHIPLSSTAESLHFRQGCSIFAKSSGVRASIKRSDIGSYVDRVPDHHIGAGSWT